MLGSQMFVYAPKMLKNRIMSSRLQSITLIDALTILSYFYVMSLNYFNIFNILIETDLSVLSVLTVLNSTPFMI